MNKELNPLPIVPFVFHCMRQCVCEERRAHTHNRETRVAIANPPTELTLVPRHLLFGISQACRAIDNPREISRQAGYPPSMKSDNFRNRRVLEMLLDQFHYH